MNAHLLTFFGGHGFGAPMEIDGGRHPIGALMGPAAMMPGAYLNWLGKLASHDPARQHFEEASALGVGGSQGAPRGGLAPDPFSMPITPLAQRTVRSSAMR